MKKLPWMKLGVSLGELVVGILLLIKPEDFTSGIVAIGGIALVLFGIVSVVRYFRMEPEKATLTSYFSTGALCVLGGLLCVLKKDWFVVTFPVLALVYGVVMLITGTVKLQWAADLIRQKKENWIPSAATAALALICGIVVILNPFKTTKVLWIFTGIALILGAVADVVALIMGKDDEDEKPAEIEETTEEPDPTEEAE